MDRPGEHEGNGPTGLRRADPRTSVLSGEYRDPELEERYRAWRYDATLPQFRVIGLLMIIAAVPFVWITYRFFGLTDGFVAITALRLLQVGLTIWVLDRVRRRVPFAQLDNSAFLAAASMLLVNAAMLFSSDGSSSLMIVQSLMVVTAAYVLYPGRLLPISAVLLLFSVLFVAMLVGHFELTRIERPGLIIWTLLANVTGFLAARQLNLFRRSEYAAHLRSQRQMEELARAHEAADDARREAEAANRAKSAMLANTSHELRTPLNAILGFSEMISKEVLGPVGQPRYLQYAGDIHHSGTHLLALIDDLLDLSKIEAGKVELQREWLDIGGMLDDARRMAGPRARARGQSIRLDIDPGLGRLFADERSMRQMLVNLLTNAIKFGPADGVIDLSARRDVDGVAVLEVLDRGPGIEPSEVERLMQPFQQAARDDQAGEGWGLGLALVKALAELHGAAFVLRPRAGGGTAAEIRFPGTAVSAGGAPRITDAQADDAAA